MKTTMLLTILIVGFRSALYLALQTASRIDKAASDK